MTIFYKMFAGNNDFIIFIDIDTQFDISFIKKLCNRKTGVGCDQLIIAKNISDCKVNMSIWNSDGSKAGACGNASRCLALLFNNESLVIQTDDREIKANRDNNAEISINMGNARIESFLLNLDNKILNIFKQSKSFKVDIGNKHLIIFCENIHYEQLEKISLHLKKTNFLEDYNLNFVKIISRNSIELAVWERGAGFTGNCGTGACASYFTARFLGLVEAKGEVLQKGENLKIEINQKNQIIQTGNANLAFTGNIDL